MEFTDQSLEPTGRVLLDMSLETDLGCKTAMVFRIMKLLQRQAFLPRYGCHLAEVCFEEALSNAMIHGNRLDPGKQVHVVVFDNGNRWGMLIQDQGEGFGPENLPDLSDPEALIREHGRGVLLMDHYMEKVRYNRKARTLWMIRGPQAEPDPGAKPPMEPPRAPAMVAAGPLSLEGLDTPATPPVAPRQPCVALPDQIGLAATPAAAEAAHDGSPVSTKLHDDVLVARIQARRLSEDNAALVREMLLASAASARHVVIDLADVEFMSSVGIGTIMAVWKQVRDRKGRLVLTGVGDPIMIVLRATGLQRALAIEPTLDAAVTKARSS